MAPIPQPQELPTSSLLIWVYHYHHPFLPCSVMFSERLGLKKEKFHYIIYVIIFSYNYFQSGPK